ncbi:MAG: hypothetical protein HY329_15655 [Chloroflexi bacterium]|nr:hypothetical protein [Chloroflexota bacterium]
MPAVAALPPAEAAHSLRAQRECCKAIILDELRHVPDVETAPLKLSSGDGSQLSKPMVSWLDSRGFLEQPLRLFVFDGSSAKEIARRMRAVRATWEHLIEDPVRLEVAVEWRIDVSTLRRDVASVMDWLVDQRWPELKQQPAVRSGRPYRRLPAVFDRP